MKKVNISFLFILCLMALSSTLYGQGGLILPMPGQKLPNKNQPPAKSHNQRRDPQPRVTNQGSSAGKNVNNRSGSTPSNSNSAISSPQSTIIPMPQSKKAGTNEEKSQKPKQASQHQPPKLSKDLKNEPLITIPVNSPQNMVRQTEDTDEDMAKFFNDDFPIPPNEVSASTQSSLDDLLEAATSSEPKVSAKIAGEKVTVFPKDTGSAIFMVMKSWKCDDYDGVKLLEQALDVYGKESGDEFQIKGYENLPQGFTISVEEEDITIDELLDIMAAKSGHDWGADVPSKIIYIYPKGIKTESYVSW